MQGNTTKQSPDPPPNPTHHGEFCHSETNQNKQHHLSNSQSTGATHRFDTIYKKEKGLPKYIATITIPTQVNTLCTGFGLQCRPSVFAIRSPAVHRCAAFSTQRRYPPKHPHFTPFPVLRTHNQQRREMRIATLQFAPKLGDVEGNISRANELLQNGKVLGGVGIGVDVLKPEILVLPELALTGMFCCGKS